MSVIIVAFLGLREEKKKEKSRREGKLGIIWGEWSGFIIEEEGGKRASDVTRTRILFLDLIDARRPRSPEKKE